MTAKKTMGWLRDLPDFRDYTPEHKEIQILLQKANVGIARGYNQLPSTVNLKKWFSPVEDQGGIGSCTAQAGVGLVEYFQRRSFGKHIDASRLFLYKVCRRLAHLEGDSGCYLRSIMGGLALFGVPPEEYWPYTDNPNYYDLEPTSFCYAFAQNYQAIKYFRLDPTSFPKDKLLMRIKTNIAANIPSMFGFSVYSSMWGEDVSKTGRIPFPTPAEDQVGGHAVVAMGYDDNLMITNPNPGGVTTKGALLIRNSWGEQWGEAGYGWLPYDYVNKGLATDWWCLLKSEWVETGQFTLD
jgi:C1A family cysteine protease